MYRLIQTYKCRVHQDDLRLVRDDVELDDVAVAVSVDDFRVCGIKKKKNICMKRTEF